MKTLIQISVLFAMLLGLTVAHAESQVRPEVISLDAGAAYDVFR